MEIIKTFLTMKKMYLLCATFLCMLTQMISAQCWSKITYGDEYAFAIQSDGTLWTWGLDINPSSIFPTLIEPPLQLGTSNNWKDVATANYQKYAVAIKHDGTLWYWGYLTSIANGYSQQIGIDTDWKQISLKGNHVLALKQNGTLWGWGSNSYWQIQNNISDPVDLPTQIGNDSNWSKISAGYTHSLAIKNDGTLWSWGYNLHGQLGINSTNDSGVPIQIGLDTNWEEISAGYHSVALKSDGTLWAWGGNDFGQLGNNTTINSLTPIQIGSTSDWVSVNAGIIHTVGLKSDGSIWSWGDNQNGQLGIGNNINQLMPQQVGTDYNWIAINAGRNNSASINFNNELFIWGANTYAQLGFQDPPDNNNVLIPNQLSCSVLSVENFFIDSNIKIYPNPTKDKIYFTNLKDISKVNVYDMIGKLVLSEKPTDNYVNIQTLPNGNYIIEIQSENKLYKSKIIKE